MVCVWLMNEMVSSMPICLEVVVKVVEDEDEVIIFLKMHQNTRSTLR